MRNKKAIEIDRSFKELCRNAKRRRRNKEKLEKVLSEPFGWVNLKELVEEVLSEGIEVRRRKK